jgi:hypothetical protein
MILRSNQIKKRESVSGRFSNAYKDNILALLTCLLVQINEKMCCHDHIVVSVLALSFLQVLAYT